MSDEKKIPETPKTPADDRKPDPGMLDRITWRQGELKFYDAEGKPLSHEEVSSRS